VEVAQEEGEEREEDQGQADGCDVEASAGCAVFEEGSEEIGYGDIEDRYGHHLDADHDEVGAEEFVLVVWVDGQSIRLSVLRKESIP